MADEQRQQDGRHIGRWVIGGIGILALGGLGYALFGNRQHGPVYTSYDGIAMGRPEIVHERPSPRNPDLENENMKLRIRVKDAQGNTRVVEKSIPYDRNDNDQKFTAYIAQDRVDYDAPVHIAEKDGVALLDSLSYGAVPYVGNPATRENGYLFIVTNGDRLNDHDIIYSPEERNFKVDMDVKRIPELMTDIMTRELFNRDAYRKIQNFETGKITIYGSKEDIRHYIQCSRAHMPLRVRAAGRRTTTDTGYPWYKIDVTSKAVSFEQRENLVGFQPSEYWNSIDGRKSIDVSYVDKDSIKVIQKTEKDKILEAQRKALEAAKKPKAQPKPSATRKAKKKYCN